MAQDLGTKEALDVLREIQGLKDAFLGFSHVVDRLSSVIRIVENGQTRVKEFEERVVTLKSEIVQLEKDKEDATIRAAREMERFANLKKQVDALASTLTQ